MFSYHQQNIDYFLSNAINQEESADLAEFKERLASCLQWVDPWIVMMMRTQMFSFKCCINPDKPNARGHCSGDEMRISPNLGEKEFVEVFQHELGHCVEWIIGKYENGIIVAGEMGSKDFLSAKSKKWKQAIENDKEARISRFLQDIMLPHKDNTDFVEYERRPWEYFARKSIIQFELYEKHGEYSSAFYDDLSQEMPDFCEAYREVFLNHIFDAENVKTGQVLSKLNYNLHHNIHDFSAVNDKHNCHEEISIDFLLNTGDTLTPSELIYFHKNIREVTKSVIEQGFSGQKHHVAFSREDKRRETVWNVGPDAKTAEWTDQARNYFLKRINSISISLD